jgi:hypothetical protein
MRSFPTGSVTLATHTTHATATGCNLYVSTQPPTCCVLVAVVERPESSEKARARSMDCMEVLSPPLLHLRDDRKGGGLTRTASWSGFRALQGMALAPTEVPAKLSSMAPTPTSIPQHVRPLPPHPITPRPVRPRTCIPVTFPSDGEVCCHHSRCTARDDVACYGWACTRRSVCVDGRIIQRLYYSGARGEPRQRARLSGEAKHLRV